MPTSRRDFLQTLGATAVAYGALPLSVDALASGERRQTHHTLSSPFDRSWPAKPHGAHRAVFDVSTIDSGFGVCRASLRENQYAEFMSARPADLSSVIVIRAEAIALAMQQSFWDAYHTGPTLKVMHPITEQPTTLNPVLMNSARNEVAGDSRRGTVGLIR